MSDVSVALTTTGFLKKYTGGELLETKLWRTNLPVCISEICLLAYGPAMEEMEHRIAQSLKDSIGVVHVDEKNKYVFVGENADMEETGLVVYTERKDSEYSKSFFSRWQETHQLLFQFSVLGNDRKPRFSLVGYWFSNHWKILEIKHSENFIVISKD